MTDERLEELRIHMDEAAAAQSDRQRARQRARNRRGRYADMNRCEACGRALGADYASLPDAGAPGKGPEGLVLCPDGRCTKGLTDDEVREAIKARRRTTR